MRVTKGGIVRAQTRCCPQCQWGASFCPLGKLNCSLGGWFLSYLWKLLLNMKRLNSCCSRWKNRRFPSQAVSLLVSLNSYFLHASPSPGTHKGWPQHRAGEARREQNQLLRCPGWMCELMGYWPYSCVNLPKYELFVDMVVIQSVDTEINLFGIFCFMDKYFKKPQQIIFFTSPDLF